MKGGCESRELVTPRNIRAWKSANWEFLLVLCLIEFYDSLRLESVRRIDLYESDTSCTYYKTCLINCLCPPQSWSLCAQFVWNLLIFVYVGICILSTTKKDGQDVYFEGLMDRNTVKTLPRHHWTMATCIRIFQRPPSSCATYLPLVTFRGLTLRQGHGNWRQPECLRLSFPVIQWPYTQYSLTTSLESGASYEKPRGLIARQVVKTPGWSIAGSAGEVPIKWCHSCCELGRDIIYLHVAIYGGGAMTGSLL